MRLAQSPACRALEKLIYHERLWFHPSASSTTGGAPAVDMSDYDVIVVVATGSDPVIPRLAMECLVGIPGHPDHSYPGWDAAFSISEHIFM